MCLYNFVLISFLSVKQYCEKLGVKHETFTDLKAACEGANVLYVTRIQRERFESEQAYEAVKVREPTFFNGYFAHINYSSSETLNSGLLCYRQGIYGNYT